MLSTKPMNPFGKIVRLFDQRFVYSNERLHTCVETLNIKYRNYSNAMNEKCQ